MLRRTKKQIIIGFIFVFIIVLFLGGIYFLFLKSSPTCFDHKKNQGEEGIDCGGLCSPCALLNLKKIETLWIKALPTSDQNYDLAARIYNPNPNHGAAKVDYEFKLYDLNNNLVLTKSGNTFILPRETKYVIEPKIAVSSAVVRITFEINPAEWQEFKNYETLNLEIFNKNFQVLSQPPIFAEASANIKNSTLFDFDTVKVVIVLLNKNNEVSAVNLAEIKNLLSGEERNFIAPWFFAIPEDISSIEMEAQTNVFDSQNFMRRYQ